MRNQRWLHGEACEKGENPLSVEALKQLDPDALKSKEITNPKKVNVPLSARK